MPKGPLLPPTPCPPHPWSGQVWKEGLSPPAQGNKGGVAIRFRLHSTTICLVNAHLAAHIEEHERRNQDFHDICARMQFRPLESSLPPLTICKHDVVLWLGDLNYRLEEKDLVLVKKLIEARDFHALYQHDQLKSQMEAKRAFQGFAEGEISFPPTYKYNMGSDDWDTSEKCRTPAWCDRILFKGNNVSQLSYRSHMSLRNSDHKPVSAVFEVGVKVVEEQLYRRVFEDIVRSLDKMENASIPSVTLSKREFLFKDVKYMQLRAQSFTIHNGPVPCQFKLINKPDEDSYCKPWLTAHPSKGFLLPEAEVTVELELFVNKATATNLNSGEDTLEDILVLHLDRGKDYFLSVSGNYLPSCFGSPIQALRYMRGPIQEMPPETIRDLTLMPLWPEEEVSWGEEPLDIPKELCMMVDHLYRNACQQEDLFQQPGLRTEFERIRDCLDSGMLDTLVASNHSVAEALLLFLESLPEPVICYQLYDNSLECADSFVLSHQVASMLPSSHKNVFHYLIAFLRELLQHSGKNLLDVKTLASIFGGILLRPPPGHPKTGISEKQKAQQFIQQFLLGEGSTPALHGHQAAPRLLRLQTPRWGSRHVCCGSAQGPSKHRQMPCRSSWKGTDDPRICMKNQHMNQALLYMSFSVSPKPCTLDAESEGQLAHGQKTTSFACLSRPPAEASRGLNSMPGGPLEAGRAPSGGFCGDFGWAEAMRLSQT
ncbi:Type II inositol 1,4,5-trisphosphate 5-phosphatase [Varanus komodoensis]|nr:Type II inositol 1,4,5-trisphosphate 5-phosphatase [Varanus komodoensis]